MTPNRDPHPDPSMIQQGGDGHCHIPSIPGKPESEGLSGQSGKSGLQGMHSKQGMWHGSLGEVVKLTPPRPPKRHADAGPDWVESLEAQECRLDDAMWRYAHALARLPEFATDHASIIAMLSPWWDVHGAALPDMEHAGARTMLKRCLGKLDDPNVKGMQRAMLLADTRTDVPAVANKYARSPRRQRLVRVGYWLDDMAGPGADFYMSSRMAAEIMGLQSQGEWDAKAGWRVLKDMVADGVFEPTDPGSAEGHRSARFKFIADDTPKTPSVPAQDIPF
jgi:hypothetical protein